MALSIGRGAMIVAVCGSLAWAVVAGAQTVIVKPPLPGTGVPGGLGTGTLTTGPGTGGVTTTPTLTPTPVAGGAPPDAGSAAAARVLPACHVTTTNSYLDGNCSRRMSATSMFLIFQYLAISAQITGMFFQFS